MLLHIKISCDNILRPKTASGKPSFAKRLREGTVRLAEEPIFNDALQERFFMH